MTDAVDLASRQVILASEALLIPADRRLHMLLGSDGVAAGRQAGQGRAGYSSGGDSPVAWVMWGHG
jgi:hypothetical protein